MNKLSVIKGIVKLYFAGAVYFSFQHVMHAWTKLGLAGTEAVAATVAIDLMFIIAMFLRSDEFATRTRKIGFWVMVVMGSLSLAGNVFAAHNLGGIIFGAMLPGYLLFSEWLADPKQIVSAKAEADALAIAAAESAVREAQEAAEAKRAASIAKGKATRARNNRTKTAETKVLEGMLKR